jgi:hypothetical protein
MSTLSCATIRSTRHVGWSVNQREPTIPSSSAVCQTKSMERAGRDARADASAMASSPTEPEPSSSAPLLIESGRAGRRRRRLSSAARTRGQSVPPGCRAWSSSPCGRTTALNARSESWSTGVGRTPT